MRVLSHEEVERLCLVVDGRGGAALRNRALVRLLAQSGVGVGEALLAQPADLDHATSSLRVSGRRSRSVALPTAVVDALEAWSIQRDRLDLTPPAPLLCSMEGHALESSYVRRLIARVGARAGIEGRLNARTLRESFAARELARGASIEELHAWLGHSTPTSTTRFLRTLPTEVAATNAEPTSERAVDLLLQSAHCGLVVVRAVRGPAGEIDDFVVEFANPAAAGIMRTSADRLLERSVAVAFPAAAEDGTYARWKDLIDRGGRAGEAERRYEESDGRTGWYSVRRAVLGDRVILSFVDQSPLRAAKALRGEGESRHSAMLGAAGEGLMMVAADGLIVEANGAAELILGLAEGQLVGRRLHDPRWRAVKEDGAMVPGDELPVAVTMATGCGVRQEVIGVRRPSGEIVWVRVSTEAVEHGGGPPFAVAVALCDIGPERRARAERRAARNALSLAFRDSRSLLIRCRPDGTILDAHGAAEVLVGLEAARLIGRRCEEAVHPHDRAAVREAYVEALSGSGPVALQHRLIHASGAVVRVDRQLEAIGLEGSPEATEVQSVMSARTSALTSAADPPVFAGA